MGSVLNLAPYFAARHIADEMKRREGHGYFTQDEPEGLAYRLDPRKLEQALELGRRDAAVRDPRLKASPRDLSTCRRLLRRDLIHDLAMDLLRIGP